MPEKRALERLAVLRRELTQTIRARFEHKARPCTACPTPGICCLDEHFVNVRISRLEARAINTVVNELPEVLKTRVKERIRTAVVKYHLEEGGSLDTRFACPLFEKGTGCLVHATAKPTACIMHACYESKEDLPPDELQDEQELKIDRLTRMVYGNSIPQFALPLALENAEVPLGSV